MSKPITVLAVTSQGATLRNNATKVEVLVGWSRSPTAGCASSSRRRCRGRHRA